MKLGYFDGCRFFRMIPDFVTQFGLPSEPALAKQVRVRVRVRVRVQPSLAALPPSVRRKQCPSVEASSRARLTAPARPPTCMSVRPSPSAISAGPSALPTRALAAQWADWSIQDEPAKTSNKQWTVAYAKAGTDSRSTQVRDSVP